MGFDCGVAFGGQRSTRVGARLVTAEFLAVNIRDTGDKAVSGCGVVSRLRGEFSPRAHGPKAAEEVRGADGSGERGERKSRRMTREASASHLIRFDEAFAATCNDPRFGSDPFS